MGNLIPKMDLQYNRNCMLSIDFINLMWKLFPLVIFDCLDCFESWDESFLDAWWKMNLKEVKLLPVELLYRKERRREERNS